MECQCLKANKKQCTRHASTKQGDNPNFCWQHQNCQTPISDFKDRTQVSPNVVEFPQPIVENKQPITSRRISPKISQTIPRADIMPRKTPVKKMPIKKPIKRPTVSTSRPITETSVEKSDLSRPITETSKQSLQKIVGRISGDNISKQQPRVTETVPLCSISSLVLGNILTKLTKRDVERLCLVSKACYQRICGDPNIWARLSKLSFGNQFEYTEPIYNLARKHRNWYFSQLSLTYVFGNNSNNVLGIYNTNYIDKLTLQPALKGIVDVSFGKKHIGYLDLLDVAFTSGETNSGQRGTGVGSISQLATDINKISCTTATTYVLNLQGVLSYVGTGGFPSYIYKYDLQGLGQRIENTLKKLISKVDDINKIKIGDKVALVVQIAGESYINLKIDVPNVFPILEYVKLDQTFFDLDGNKTIKFPDREPPKKIGTKANGKTLVPNQNQYIILVYTKSLSVSQTHHPFQISMIYM